MVHKTNVRQHKRRTKRGTTTVHNHSRSLKNMSYSQLKRHNIHLAPKHDADGDGVVNFKDCQPLNPKKQGLLHDLQVRRLEKQEERLELKREKEQKKLEDLQDKLQRRQGISSKKNKIGALRLKQKQVIIDQINDEKSKAKKLKMLNREAKAQLDKLTLSGRTKNVTKAAIRNIGQKSSLALKATAAFLNKKSTRRTLNRIGKEIGF